MNFGILGTGMVGNSLATKLVELGHNVKMGSRTFDNEKATRWANANGDLASNGTFSDAAGFGEIVFNCTLGAVSLEALSLAGEENLNGKIIIDVSNPFVLGEYLGLVPELSNGTSLGEEIKKIENHQMTNTINS